MGLDISAYSQLVKTTENGDYTDAYLYKNDFVFFEQSKGIEPRSLLCRR